MKTIDYISDAIPTYALSYFVNGDASGMEDEDIQAADAWFDGCTETLRKDYPTARMELVLHPWDTEGSFTPYPAFGLACDTVPGAIVAVVGNDEPGDAMRLPWEPDLKSTPEIHARDISSVESMGDVETEREEIYHVVKVRHTSGLYLVAGSACNAGLLPEFARLVDEEYETPDDVLSEFVADISAPEQASGELLAWHGSLCLS